MGAHVDVTSALNTATRIQLGVVNERHLVLSKAFRHLAFGFASRLSQPAVVIAAPLIRAARSSVYLNVLNALFPPNVTFVGPQIRQPSLPMNPYGSYNGETVSVLLFFVPVDFHFINPETIQTFDLFGIAFSGSLSATVFAPYEIFYNSLNIQLL